VPLSRAVDTFNEIFTKLLPSDLFIILRKQLERLTVKVENSPVVAVDVDKFLDFSIQLHMRFLHSPSQRLEHIYEAWTLHSHNFMTINEFYLTLRVMAD